MWKQFSCIFWDKYLGWTSYNYSINKQKHSLIYKVSSDTILFMIVETENEVYFCCLKLEWLKPTDVIILGEWRKGWFGVVGSCGWVKSSLSWQLLHLCCCRCLYVCVTALVCCPVLDWPLPRNREFPEDRNCSPL